MSKGLEALELLGNETVVVKNIKTIFMEGTNDDAYSYLTLTQVKNINQDCYDIIKQELERLEVLKKAFDKACERLDWDCPVSQDLIDDLDCENCKDTCKECWKKYFLKEMSEMTKKEIEKIIINECIIGADKILKEAKEKTNDSVYECVLTKEEYEIILGVVNKYYTLLNNLFDIIEDNIK